MSSLLKVEEIAKIAEKMRIRYVSEVDHRSFIVCDDEAGEERKKKSFPKYQVWWPDYLNFELLKVTVCVVSNKNIERPPIVPFVLHHVIKAEEEHPSHMKVPGPYLVYEFNRDGLKNPFHFELKNIDLRQTKNEDPSGKLRLKDVKKRVAGVNYNELYIKDADLETFPEFYHYGKILEQANIDPYGAGYDHLGLNAELSESLNSADKRTECNAAIKSNGDGIAYAINLTFELMDANGKSLFTKNIKQVVRHEEKPKQPSGTSPVKRLQKNTNKKPDRKKLLKVSELVQNAESSQGSSQGFSSNVLTPLSGQASSDSPQTMDYLDHAARQLEELINSRKDSGDITVNHGTTTVQNDNQNWAFATESSALDESILYDFGNILSIVQDLEMIGQEQPTVALKSTRETENGRVDEPGTNACEEHSQLAAAMSDADNKPMDAVNDQTRLVIPDDYSPEFALVYSILQEKEQRDTSQPEIQKSQTDFVVDSAATTNQLITQSDNNWLAEKPFEKGDNFYPFEGALSPIPMFCPDKIMVDD